MRLLVMVMLLASCNRSASQSPVMTPTTSAPGIVIEQVQVTQGAGIYTSGRSNLPAGECVLTMLLADGAAAEWWPEDACVEVDNGRWELLVALGRDGAPGELAQGVEYELRAWWPAQPDETMTRFPFDLDGPK